MRADGTFTVKAFVPTEVTPDRAVTTGLPDGVARTEKHVEVETDGAHRIWFECELD
ncbi:hypothetical protein [Streptomyces sp. NPDC059597]|uniref:hypothetical protein n=1 Tax=Streptomyces sp. NPDC059597 TaxID=3346879 RepID=UPI0036C9013D